MEMQRMRFSHKTADCHFHLKAGVLHFVLLHFILQSLDQQYSENSRLETYPSEFLYESKAKTVFALPLHVMCLTQWIHMDPLKSAYYMFPIMLPLAAAISSK